MESNEDSIKILEMRIRQQMNNSLQKNMKPENIKYYMPSAVLPKRDILQDPQSADAAGTVNPAGNGSDPGSAADVLKMSMPLSDGSKPVTPLPGGPKPVTPLPGGPKPVTPLPGDPKPVMPVSDVPEPGSQAADADSPVGIEYIDRAVGMPPMVEYEHIEIPESKEIQHAKALTGYETSRSLDRKGTFRMEDMHFLDAKG